MIKIVVLSDTHGYRKGLDEISDVLAENDMIIHLGDTSGDEQIIQAEGVKIFACHGHRYSVKTTLARLAEKASGEGCAVALYGHTHTAREDVIDGVTLLNPGCGTRYGARSYLYLVVNGDKFTYKTVRLNS